MARGVIGLCVCLIGILPINSLFAKGSDSCVTRLRRNLREDFAVTHYLDKGKSEFDTLLEAERESALAYLKENILPNGAVRAATSGENPNYLFDWHRDRSLVYMALWKESHDVNILKQFAMAEIEFLNRNSPGEPKAHLDFSPFTDEWAKPQNDGAALAILPLATLAHLLLQTGKPEDLKFVEEYLYCKERPARDLVNYLGAYVASVHNFKKDVEPWEEDHGIHFYNGKAQVAALVAAARLAETLKDAPSATGFLEQAQMIDKRLWEKHWDPVKKRIIPNIARAPDSFFKDKPEDLDIQILLAYLHTDSKVADSRLLSSFHQLRLGFKDEYLLNREEKKFRYAVAMGRYLKDKWDGNTRTGASPWFLATFASAEFFFKLLTEIKTEKGLRVDSNNIDFYRELVKAFDPEMQIPSGQYLSEESPQFRAIKNALEKAADEFLMLGLSHGGDDGRLHEQFNNSNGHMQGAENLTWSYAAELTALQARRAYYSGD